MNSHLLVVCGVSTSSEGNQAEFKSLCILESCIKIIFSPETCPSPLIPSALRLFPGDWSSPSCLLWRHIACCRRDERHKGTGRQVLLGDYLAAPRATTMDLQRGSLMYLSLSTSQRRTSPTGLPALSMEGNLAQLHKRLRGIDDMCGPQSLATSSTASTRRAYRASYCFLSSCSPLRHFTSAGTLVYPGAALLPGTNTLAALLPLHCCSSLSIVSCRWL